MSRNIQKNTQTQGKDRHALFCDARHELTISILESISSSSQILSLVLIVKRKRTLFAT